MESNKNQINRLKLAGKLQRSDSYDSLNFHGLEGYRKEAEEHLFMSDQDIHSRKSNKTQITHNNTESEPEKYYIRKNSSKIKLKDKIVLSDVEKYYKFGIFPYIVLTHIFIVFLTTLIVNY